MDLVKKIKDLKAEEIACDIVIEFCSVYKTKYQAKKKNIREELKVCQNLAKAQKDISKLATT